MTDQNLSELLERAGDRAPVGPPPVAAMVAGAARHRRRRRLAISVASAAAVAAAVASPAFFSAPDAQPDPRPPVTSPEPVVTPPGSRLVGLGHAAIAVPEAWGTNATRCGVPQRDTVVIDVGGIRLCGAARPDGVESVELTQGSPRFDFTVDDTFEIDGVPAQRQAITCAAGSFGGARTCAGTVRIPSLGVSFRAESSTGTAEVDRILGWIRIVPGVVGVPGFQTITMNQQGGAQERYLQVLREAGLSAEVRTRKVPGVDAGYILEVEPEPGTMLEPGGVVRVTAVAEPEGPADEVRVGVSSGDAAEDDYQNLEDAQIRRGATIELAVGDRIWAYAAGRRSHTLAGGLEGSSLVVDGWEEGPNYPHSWLAVAPGRTTVTLNIVADDEAVVLGVVTVVVSRG